MQSKFMKAFWSIFKKGTWFWGKTNNPSWLKEAAMQYSIKSIIYLFEVIQNYWITEIEQWQFSNLSLQIV